MGLETKIEYKSKIKNFNGISPDSVKEMFYDIKSSISRLDNSFEKLKDKEILKIIEEGKYKIKNEQFDTIIDLSYAEAIISSYRENSEGGCQSCVSNHTYVIDAQDHSSQDYCAVSKPNYLDLYELRKAGLTKKIHEHYHSPCSEWKPKFSPTIEKLLKLE